MSFTGAERPAEPHLAAAALAAVALTAVADLPARRVHPRVAHGDAVGHHGEILQGVFESADGRLRRGLVSLVTPAFRSYARFRLAKSGPLRVEPSWKVKALRAAELTLAHCGATCTGVLTIENNMVPRWGLGSSTSDVVAAARAVARVVGRSLTPDALAGIAVKAEMASDSAMFGGRAVLFAQRDGVVLEDLGSRLPPIHVIGFNTDPTGWGIDTLELQPARYSWREIEAFRPLLGLLRRAVETRDAHALGRVASASARINQRHLPKPRFDECERIGERCGAVGLQVAHSGSVMGLLVPDNDTLAEQSEAAQRYLSETGIRSTWSISTEFGS